MSVLSFLVVSCAVSTYLATPSITSVSTYVVIAACSWLPSTLFSLWLMTPTGHSAKLWLLQTFCCGRVKPDTLAQHRLTQAGALFWFNMASAIAPALYMGFASVAYFSPIGAYYVYNAQRVPYPVFVETMMFALSQCLICTAVIFGMRELIRKIYRLDYWYGRAVAGQQWSCGAVELWTGSGGVEYERCALTTLLPPLLWSCAMSLVCRRIGYASTYAPHVCARPDDRPRPSDCNVSCRVVLCRAVSCCAVGRTFSGAYWTYVHSRLHTASSASCTCADTVWCAVVVCGVWWCAVF
jgi:hypothetical protein